jgi:anaerobic ribonucleoside-triphosphate reductase
LTRYVFNEMLCRTGNQMNKANYNIDKITIFNRSCYSIKIVQKNMTLVQDITGLFVLFIISLLDDLNSFYNGTL